MFPCSRTSWLHGMLASSLAFYILIRFQLKTWIGNFPLCFYPSPKNSWRISPSLGENYNWSHPFISTQCWKTTHQCSGRQCQHVEQIISATNFRQEWEAELVMHRFQQECLWNHGCLKGVIFFKGNWTFFIFP